MLRMRSYLARSQLNSGVRWATDSDVEVSCWFSGRAASVVCFGSVSWCPVAWLPLPS